MRRIYIITNRDAQVVHEKSTRRKALGKAKKMIACGTTHAAVLCFSRLGTTLIRQWGWSAAEVAAYIRAAAPAQPAAPRKVTMASIFRWITGRKAA